MTHSVLIVSDFDLIRQVTKATLTSITNIGKVETISMKHLSGLTRYNPLWGFNPDIVIFDLDSRNLCDKKHFDLLENIEQTGIFAYKKKAHILHIGTENQLMTYENQESVTSSVIIKPFTTLEVKNRIEHLLCDLKIVPQMWFSNASKPTLQS